MKRDFLKREKTVQQLILVVDRLAKMERGLTFALDGRWGSGKSFLLDMFEEQLREIQSEEYYDQKYFVVKYNCWEHDFYPEPIIAILSAVREQVEEEVRLFPDLKNDAIITGALELLKKYVEECSGKFIESKFGFNPVDIYYDCKESGQKIVSDINSEDTYYSLKKVLSNIRLELQKIGKRKTIVFIVDELDRCLPEYAISTLERLHHFFSGISNFITILAIDKSQLCEVVRQAYGNEFNVDAYLKKIIDFYFVIDNGEIERHYLEKYNEYKNKFTYYREEDLLWAEKEIVEALSEMTIRAQEKLFQRAELIHDMIVGGKCLDISCMVFEILTLCFDEPKQIKNFLLKSKDDIESCTMKNVNGKKYICLTGCILHKILWYVENLDRSEKAGFCGEYYFSDHTESSLAVKEMKLFEQLKRVICL